MSEARPYTPETLAEQRERLSKTHSAGEMEPPADYTESEWLDMIDCTDALEDAIPDGAWDAPARKRTIGVPIPDAPIIRQSRFDPWRGMEQVVSISNMTYVIRCGDFVKIGITKDIHQRLAAMETGNPYELEVVALLAGGRDVERQLHKRFAQYRHRCEWFKIEGRLASWIENGCPEWVIAGRENLWRGDDG